MGPVNGPEKAVSDPEEGLGVDKQELRFGEAADVYGDSTDANRYGYVQRGYVLAKITCLGLQVCNELTRVFIVSSLAIFNLSR